MRRKSVESAAGEASRRSRGDHQAPSGVCLPLWAGAVRLLCVTRLSWMLALGLAAAFGLGSPALAGPEVPEGARAGAALAGPEKDPRAVLSLLLDRESAQPGDRVRVGVLFELAPDWHMYWRFSGESGLPTELRWSVSAPAGGPVGEVGALNWPAPLVFREDEGFITTYGYADEVLLSAELEVPEAASGPQRIEVEADFLVCKIQCIPGRATLVRELPVANGSAAGDSESVALFERFAREVPVAPEAAGVALEAVYSQSAIRPGDGFRAGISISACAEGDSVPCEQVAPGRRVDSDVFVPDAIVGVELKSTGIRPHPTQDGGLIAIVEGTAGKDPWDGERRLRGVLALAGTEGRRYVEVDLPLPTDAAGAEVVPLAGADTWLVPVASTTAAPASLGVVLQALLYAFLGGLILNLMPCVFPVLAIKVFSVAEMASTGRHSTVGQGIAYAGGVLVSMLALAAVVVALRAAGLAVGWGFQFQEPLFVVAVGTVLVVFALNLFGVFEIAPDLTRVSQLGEGATGNARSFFEGLLAVVLATPCSAPYLGAAVGFAFAGSAALIFALFGAIGIGLAAPYVAITCVPGLGRWLPSPGAWMLHLRTALGFALLATVVWLLSILSGIAGAQALILSLAFLLGVALVVWMYGIAQAADRRVWARALALGGVLVLGVIGSRLPLEPIESGAEGELAEGAGLDARAFDAEGVRAALGAGTPVFVYFTADWCLTCKINERFVLEDPAVRAELDALDFDVFIGDWTRRDDRIREELARFGRAAVPMYLVYSPNAPGEPELLPELLTSELLIDALKRAAQGSARAADHTGGDKT